jgi:hypothetical protein
MPDTFEKIFVITKNKDEPLYNYLGDRIKDFGSIKEGIPELPDLDKLDKNQNNLIVLDDLCNESKRQQQPICDYFIRARKKNCSIIYISQSFYQVPKLIRDNISYLIIKQVSSSKSLTMIMRECGLGVDRKTLKKIYEDATDKKQKKLLIDFEVEPAEKFRKNLDEIYVINEQ